MDDTTVLGAALGQLGQTVKQAAKQVVKIPEEMAQDLAGQVGRGGETKQENKQWESDEEREKFLRGLYGAPQSSFVNSPDKSASFALTSGASAAKPEEQKELMALRNQLHREVYFDPTFNPVKKQEERPAEKVENEKKEEVMDLQKKEEKKPQPLAVTREQNKAEQFRGASG